MVRSLILAAALFVAGPGAHAGPEAEAAIAEAATIVTGPSQRTSALIDRMDADAIARFTLGRHARSFTAADVARYSEALEAFLATMIERESGRFAGSDVEIIGSIDRSPSDSIVSTRIYKRDGQTDTIRWRLMARNNGWRIVDVEVAGLWLAIEQRAQIGAILGRRGASIDDAIAALAGPA